MNDHISRKALLEKAQTFDEYIEGQNVYFRFIDENEVFNAPAVEAEPKWISVKDSLPEQGDYVLVCDTREDWYGLWEFSGSAWYDASYQPWSIDEVTHWQYLPQPPKGE